jgi:hypothetical protein
MPNNKILNPLIVFNFLMLTLRGMVSMFLFFRRYNAVVIDNLDNVTTICFIELGFEVCFIICTPISNN